MPPAGSTNVVYREIGATRRWGSAVVGPTVEVEEITAATVRANRAPVQLCRTFPGSELDPVSRTPILRRHLSPGRSPMPAPTFAGVLWAVAGGAGVVDGRW